jgi:putative ABC transport system permease protein
VGRNYIDYLTGNFKITTSGFAKYERFLPAYEYIPDSAALVSNLSLIKGVTLAEERIRFGIIIGKGEKSEAAMGIGADLRSSRLGLESRIAGGKIDSEGLYVCGGLADRLGIKTGDRLLLAAETSERGLNGIKLPVKGIIHFGISMIDKRSFFIDLKNARKLLKMQGGITEIYVFTGSGTGREAMRGRIDKILPAGLVSRDPDQQTGGIYSMMQSVGYALYVLLVLILLLASFVVVNTMVMAVYERMKEIGTLKAIGMSDGGIFLNFTIEGIIIGSAGGITGGLSGYLLVVLSAVKGLNFSSMLKNRETPVSTIVYPSTGIEVLLAAVIIAVLISTAAAVIPALRARKTSPADALRSI